MAKKYPGLYLYYDWIDALAGIPAAKAMTVIKNLRNFAQYGTEPPPIEGPAGCLQTLFAAQITRAKVNAENGKLGGAPTHKKPSPPSNYPQIIPAPMMTVHPDLSLDDFDSIEEHIAYMKGRREILDKTRNG